MNAGGASSDRGRGPSRLGLAALALSAFALLATSPGTPSLTGRVVGEVLLSGGETVERSLRIHVDRRGGGGKSGSIDTSFEAASGLEPGHSDDVTITLADATEAAGPYKPDVAFPFARCGSGCDLTYRIRITAGPGVLPGSVVRYAVEVRIYYDFQSGPPRDPALLRLDLEGASLGPALALLSILAGLLALGVGIVTGPRLQRVLDPARRSWPGRGLILVAVGLAAWAVIGTAMEAGRYDILAHLARRPMDILAIVDPWSVLLLGTLAWGVWQGLRQWPSDGGWLLGLAAVAMTGLAGLWLAWLSTRDAVIQPIVLVVPFVLLGSLGGIVIGQGWRTDAVSHRDRSWAAFAVLGHGIVLAGFGFLAEQFLYDPFGDSTWSLLALIPLGLIGWAFHRWLAGRQRWLVFFDLIVAAIGLLGLLLYPALGRLGSITPGPIKIGDVAVWIAVVAALVAFVSSLHGMPRSEDPSEGGGIPKPVAPIEAAPLNPVEPPADGLPTT